LQTNTKVEELCYIAQVSGAYEFTRKASDSPLSPVLQGLYDRRNVGEASYMEHGSYTKPFEAFLIYPLVGQMIRLLGI
jgi:hypothetical protein